jgi:hypothetical protein
VQRVHIHFDDLNSIACFITVTVQTMMATSVAACCAAQAASSLMVASVSGIYDDHNTMMPGMASLSVYALPIAWARHAPRIGGFDSMIQCVLHVQATCCAQAGVQLYKCTHGPCVLTRQLQSCSRCDEALWWQSFPALLHH